ncbi:MAG: endonuclease/exonuclease/phosphatase family protein [Kiritimatiellae bacterium]|nr:endonuclease/exonuclease/phosphatase family protein [Kiritimatiellia bacterium]
MNATRTDDLGIVTFNVRTGTCERGTPDAWAERRGDCIALMLGGGYDFIGLQEVQWRPEDPDCDQAGDLRRGLAARGYGMVGRSREARPDVGEGAPVFYRLDRWEPDPDAQGTLWLSETPDVPDSRSWDSQCPRAMTWVRFRELAGGDPTGRTVLFANTHFDHIFEHTMLLQAELSDRLLAERARPGEPVFLTGDFNAYERSWPVRHLLGETVLPGAIRPAPLPFRDAWRECHPGERDARTFHHWGEWTNDNRIDYVLFAGPGVRPVSADIDRTLRPNGRFPSDHYPVRTRFELSPAAR